MLPDFIGWIPGIRRTLRPAQDPLLGGRYSGLQSWYGKYTQQGQVRHIPLGHPLHRAHCSGVSLQRGLEYGLLGRSLGPLHFFRVFHQDDLAGDAYDRGQHRRRARRLPSVDKTGPASLALDGRRHCPSHGRGPCRGLGRVPIRRQPGARVLRGAAYRPLHLCGPGGRGGGQHRHVPGGSRRHRLPPLSLWQGTFRRAITCSLAEAKSEGAIPPPRLWFSPNERAGCRKGSGNRPFLILPERSSWS